MNPTYYITLESEYNVNKLYYSMYGGFTEDIKKALEFSFTGAGLRLERIIGMSRHPQYAEWKNAKVEQVGQEVVIY